MLRLVAFAALLGRLCSGQVEVTPLVEEWALDKMINTFTLVTWSTLVRDGDQLIIVDLPPTNATIMETKMKDALKERNLTPESIHKLIITHGHPKNFGHNSAFPNANQFFSTYEHNGKTFLRTALYENGKVQVTPNVQLWYTPGNAPEDITVVVSNVPDRGVVAIAGNLIFNSNDILEPSFWESKAQHLHAGIKRRRKVICHANYVIPGHGPIFAVTEQHKEAVKCQKPHGQGAADDPATDEQKRRRRQDEQEQERSRQQAFDQQRYDQLRRQQELEYQRRVNEWKQQQEEERLRQQGQQSQDGQIQVGGIINTDGNGNTDCCAQQPCANNQQMCSVSCCVQQPCLVNQPMCSAVCCSQPPCQYNQPPCHFASSCCQQQSCGWNQLRCQTNCQPRQDCKPPVLPPQPPAPRCEQTETHHHYIGAEQEIFRNHVRKEHNDLTTTLNDQQKQLRADQEKVNQILLEHLGGLSDSIQNWLEGERQRQNEWRSMISRQQQEKAEMDQRHARELADFNNQPPQPPIDLRQDQVQRALEEHKRTADQWWTHQRHVEETKRAQEEVTYKRVVKPAYNYSNTVKREPCPTHPPLPPQLTVSAPTPCTSSCNTGCSTGCNTGCVQGCATGCTQSCSPCTDPYQLHRHAPGQRHFGRRRRIRRHPTPEERRQRKLHRLQELQLAQEAREED